jgi:tripartite-type tricarboxylate transporter receptor subunit TctC
MVLAIFSVLLSILGQPAEAATNSSSENQWIKDYPSRPITIIVPASTGSGYDVMARKVAEVLPKYLSKKVTVFVEDLSASSGAEGYSKLYNAKPDGYTLLFHGVANGWLTQKMYGFPYEIEEMTVLCSVTDESGQLSVAPDSKIKTMDEFITKYKATGEIPVFSTSGAGVATHTQALGTMEILGIPSRFVHYGGTGEAVSGLTRHETEFMYIAYESALSYLQSNMMKCMVLLGNKRQAATPDVPTIYEVKGVTEEQAKKIDKLTTSHRTMWAPPKMDPDLRNLIITALEKTFADPDYLEWANSVGRSIHFVGGEQAAVIMQEAYDAQREFLNLFIETLKGKK